MRLYKDVLNIFVVLLWVLPSLAMDKANASTGKSLAESIIIRDVREFATHFTSERLVDRLYCTEGLAGRIVTHGQNFLGGRDSDKVCFVMGSDGLDGLMALGCHNHFEMLEKIGFTREYICDRFHLGRKWDLVVISQKEMSEVYWATWDGVFAMMKRYYPDIYEIAQGYREKLEQLTFLELKALAGYDIGLVKKDSEQYMNYENFKARFITTGVIPTVTDVRAFLWHELWLTELFAGDGYTRDDKGTKGLKEYLMLNKKLSDLNPIVILPLDHVKIL